MPKKILLPLLYHDIRTGQAVLDREDVEQIPYIIERTTFEKHVSLLRENGFESITSSDLIRFSEKSHAIPDKAVLITFDDGHVSNFTEAFPVLKRYGFKGIFFVTTGWIDKPQMLSREQIKVMYDSGIEIGSHTESHPIPTLLKEEELRTELQLSKKKLEDIINAPINSLSSPTGFYDQRMKKIAHESGYHALYVGITSLHLPAQNEIDLLWINRIDIKAGITLTAFQGILSGNRYITAKTCFKEQFLGKVKSLVGPHYYNNIRRVILEHRRKYQ